MTSNNPAYSADCLIQGLNAANKELEKANAEKDAIIQKYKEKYGDLG